MNYFYIFVFMENVGCIGLVEGISLQAAVTKTSTCPALVDLLDWLEEIERFYYNWYVVH